MFIISLVWCGEGAKIKIGCCAAQNCNIKEKRRISTIQFLLWKLLALVYLLFFYYRGAGRNARIRLSSSRSSSSKWGKYSMDKRLSCRYVVKCCCNMGPGDIIVVVLWARSRQPNGRRGVVVQIVSVGTVAIALARLRRRRHLLPLAHEMGGCALKIRRRQLNKIRPGNRVLC